ncbi:MAG TPA: zinc-binding dehydrogenase [Mycobacteriales bacterium]|jgi:NADPH2:quinone reductase|nr:zinc-binding dehydrogenase [Mycobacteriales bacterium]
MKAIRQYEFGDADTLRYEDAPDPVPGPDHVRIRVEAAGVHLIDASLRRGEQPGPPLPTLPTVPGREVAGVVDSPGPWSGQRVVAHLGPAGGGYASLAVAPVSSLHEVPSSLSLADAVALVGTGRTALAILEDAEVIPSDVVLIPGAAGGLGTLLTQAAHDAGAMTVGLVGSPAKAAQVTADLVIDYSVPDWLRQVPDATVLLDGTGGAIGRSLFERVRPGGRVIMFGWSSGTPTEFGVWDLYRLGLTVSCSIGARMATRTGGLHGLAASALARTWKPLITSFPLSDAAGAHRAMEGRQTVGKTVLIP